MKVNKKKVSIPVYTHEGARAHRAPNSELELRRSVLSTMLWEDSFYEDGESIANRIATGVANTDPNKVAKIAIDARGAWKLRHAPLLVVREMAKLPSHKSLVASTLSEVIQRPDELAEFISIYWKNGKEPLANQVKKGLATAFKKFNEYSLSKYKGKKNEISLRDAMFLVHPKPESMEQAMLFKKVADQELATPDTWEVAISNCKSSEEKKAEWTRLLKEDKLGALALLRNLRNFEKVGVDETLIRTALSKIKTDRVLPYRFIAAARYAPQFEPELEEAMFKCTANMDKLPGRTVLLIDVSGSMDYEVSDKSDLKRIDAACGLAMLIREISEYSDIYTFSENLHRVPNRRGFALRDAIDTSQRHGGTNLGSSLNILQRKLKTGKEDCGYDRLIIVTDEQSRDVVAKPNGKGYVINVGSYQYGLSYAEWIKISGFSEAVVAWISEYEKLKKE